VTVDEEMNRFELLNKTAVIGAGLMGTQIGVVLARGSRIVCLMSRHESTLQRAERDSRSYLDQLSQHGLLRGENTETLLKRIRITRNLPEALADADMVVESIPEDLGVKQALYERIERTVTPECLLVSNTSSLPISLLAEKVRHPGRMAGSHFIQPAHIVPVVEIVAGKKTDGETMERLTRLWKRMDKIPLRVNRDVPGFLVNRLQHALIREAVRLLAQGVASAEDIDLAVRLGLGPRFVTAGPLEQRDLNGLQMHRQVAGYLWKYLDGFQEPLRYLDRLVDQGNTGLESGRGFYDWRGRQPSLVRNRRAGSLFRLCGYALEEWREENNIVDDGSRE
jgi:3-hydroxybutyryl-CoA dehydrogenase